MKRILFILHLPPPVHGSSMVGQIIRESELINAAYQCRYINLSTSRTVDEIGKNPLTKVGRYLEILGRVLWQLLCFRPDICYITPTSGGMGFYKDVPVLLLAGLTGAKKLYHYHNKGIRKYQERVLDNMLYRLVFRRASVTLLSEYLYNDIEKYVPRERVSFCANGVGISRQLVVSSGDEDGEEVGSGQLVVGSKQTEVRCKRIEILFLSNLIESKGVYVLLEACGILKNKGIPFHCTLVGGEGDITVDELAHKLFDAELTDCVQYAGKQYGMDKEAFWNKAELFTLPTYYHNECMPLVLLEAMQHGLPIVSTTEGAIPEIVRAGETGYLVEKQNAVALAASLEILITNAELRMKMGKEGRRFYEQLYTQDAFEKRIFQIFGKLTNTHRTNNEN